MKTILQYQISDWHQAPKVQSNFSPELRITVTDLMQNDDINGIVVGIEHKKFGTLFSAMIEPFGELIDSEVPRSLSRDLILNELKRFGFYVSWVEEVKISNSIATILQTAYNLGFEKLRLVSVHDDTKLEEQQIYVAAFNIDKLPFWINTNYSPSKSEWERAIVDGNALNLSNLDKNNLDWSWLYNSMYDILSLIGRNLNE